MSCGRCSQAEHVNNYDFLYPGAVGVYKNVAIGLNGGIAFVNNTAKGRGGKNRNGIYTTFYCGV